MKERAYCQNFNSYPFQKKICCMEGHYPVLERMLLNFPRGILLKFDEALAKKEGYSRNRLKYGNFSVQDAITIQRKFFPNVPLEKLFEYHD